MHWSLGHNNDQGMMNLTEINKYIINNELTWAADNGYHHSNLIVPSNDYSKKINDWLKGLRSVVEVTAGSAKNFEFASSKVRQTPEVQELGLRVIYNLINNVIKQFPIRPS